MIIRPSVCVGCDACRDVCPIECISISYQIKEDECIECDMCLEVCPVGAITETNTSVATTNNSSISQDNHILKDALAWTICYGGTAAAQAALVSAIVATGLIDDSYASVLSKNFSKISGSAKSSAWRTYKDTGSIQEMLKVLGISFD